MPEEQSNMGPKLLLTQTVAHFFQHFFPLKNLMDVIAALRYVRRLGLEAACEELPRSMGLSERLDQARLAADEFIQMGRAPSIPWRQGARGVLAIPTPMKRAELHICLNGRGHRQNFAAHIW